MASAFKVEKLTVADLLDQYIKDRRSMGRGKKACERYNEIADLWIMPHIGNVLIRKLTPRSVKELLNVLGQRGSHKGKPLAASSVVLAHRMLSGALSWAVQLEKIGRNVADVVKPPSIPRSPAIAQSLDDARKILTAADDSRWGPYMRLALLFGPRRGELLALKRDLTDVQHAEVTIAASLSQTRDGIAEKSTKADRIRRVSLSPLMIESFKRQAELQEADRRKALRAGKEYFDSGHVFQKPLGGPIRPDKATGAFRRITKNLGIETTSLHSLRHTAGRWMIASGVDPRTAADILGHRKASVTLDVYSHALPEIRRPP